MKTRFLFGSPQFVTLWLFACLSLAGLCLFKGLGGNVPHMDQPAAAAILRTLRPQAAKERIDDVQLGDRVVGRNPLQGQAELIEPNPPTWRRISFEMRKQNGLSLWIELLRPLEWLATNNAAEGMSVFLSLPEMGALGDAKVIRISGCPTIQSGKGAVVTGKFIHECDGSNVVQLQLEGERQPTGVTANHPYWSEDRQDFVEASQLQSGEMVGTEFGPRRVIAIIPFEYRGPLYNIETTEHVYRVADVGALVHNSCVPNRLTRDESDAFREAARDLWQNRTGRRARWDDLDVHHRIPLEWSHKFPKADPNRVANLVGVDYSTHSAINGEWRAFKAALGGREPTAPEIMKKVLHIDELYGDLFTFLP